MSKDEISDERQASSPRAFRNKPSDALSVVNVTVNPYLPSLLLPNYRAVRKNMGPWGLRVMLRMTCSCYTGDLL